MQQTPYSPQAEDSQQTLLGRYRVLSTNTEGGFGAVSVCWDSRLQRRVAIKHMPLRVDDDSVAIASSVGDALAEARTSSMLAHPNIVRMYDFESDDRYSYLVMEYVDGLNLADLITRVEGGVLTFDECAHLVDSLSSALAYAHENGVLHLDIKPANILIDRTGTVKLSDFGMASLASAAGYGGARGGTVGYMPPEQIEGDLVDERTDIFSLAVVVWEALTGSCPYAADTPEESLKLIKHGPSPTLSHVEPELAGVVEETLLRALDPNPSARMSTVQAFARDLVRALGDEQEGAESLCYLLNQTEEDAEPDVHQNWDRLYVPIQIRFPWLGGALTRTLAAATAAWAAFQAVPLLFPNQADALAFGVVGVAAASVAWPPLAGMLGITALIGAICSVPSRLAFPLALLVGVIGLVWWVAIGRRYRQSGPALLLPSCLASPLAGIGLASYTMAPTAAFCTGALSWLTWLVFDTGSRLGFEAESLGAGLAASLATPQAWLILGGCGLSACVAAAVGRHAGIARGIVGQVLGLAILGLTYAACTQMENADNAAALDAPALGIAVSLGAIICIATILTGGYVHNLEGDERA